MAPMKAIVGIDIGTTYSTIGIWRGDTIQTITIPMCISFSDRREPMIGVKAKDRLDKNINVKNTVADVKCFMGETYEDIIMLETGTTYSTIGIWRGNTIRTVSIPMCVAFTDHNEPIIGEKAIEQLDTNVPNTIVDARRLIGGRYSDIDVGEDLIRLRPFPAEIVCRILIRLTKIVEKELGTKEVVTDAVICVPSFFNNSQRIATMDAARMAGVNVLRLINETSATALAYRWSDESCCKKRQEEHSSESRSDLMKKEEDVLVFDIGSGSLSVSVIKIKPGWKEFEVKAATGDTHLGGNDMDAALAAYCVQEFTKFHPNRQQPEEIVINDKSRNTLRSECELARMVLCSPDNKLARTTVNVKSFDGTFPMSVIVAPDIIDSLQFHCIQISS